MGTAELPGPKDQPVDTRTLVSIGLVGPHYARCEPCQCGQHYATPTWHTWAGKEDVEHARKTGQPDPTTSVCGCPCVHDPGFCAQYGEPEPEPDYDDESLDADPCPVCSATGACGYDTEGRPMIHSLTDSLSGDALDGFIELGRRGSGSYALQAEMVADLDGDAEPNG